MNGPRQIRSIAKAPPEDRPKKSWRPKLLPHHKQSIPAGRKFFHVTRLLEESGLSTVCQGALCPNRAGCWSGGSLAFQILGDLCTRRCAFCGEKTGRPRPPDPSEPEKLAAMARRLGLAHVVITSPSRDDLPDHGAGQFVACLEFLRKEIPRTTVELLVPDFQRRPDLLKSIIQMRPDIFNHNLETVRRLTPEVRARALYDRSLQILRWAAEAGLRVKSGLMVGLGETREEIRETLTDLKRNGVSLLTVGQYLPPSPRHRPLDRLYSPEEFSSIREEAAGLFENVLAGPLVRSSYHAAEMAGAR